MDLKPRESYFNHDGLRLHYWEWGDPNEETYVFVHGVRDQGRSWDPFIAAMIARVADQACRGHRSAWPWRQRVPSTGRGYQHEDFLTDLAGLLRHLGKEPLTIIGHSLGGSMCLLYAGAFPEKVKRMVLLESLGPFARADEEVPELSPNASWEEIMSRSLFPTSPWRQPPKRCRRLFR
jgi:pimeloyl-ACP methyl ester carboxylesterase